MTPDARATHRARALKVLLDWARLETDEFTQRHVRAAIIAVNNANAGKEEDKA